MRSVVRSYLTSAGSHEWRGSRLGQKMIGTPRTTHWNYSQFTSLPAPEERAWGHSRGRPSMGNGIPAAIVSRNEGSGFFGAVRAYAGPEEAWALALRSIANATSCSDEAVRVF